MTKILATTDASTLGQQGVKHAMALAQALGAEVTVLTIQADPSPGIAGEFGYIPPMSPEDLLTQEQELRAELSRDFPDLVTRVERSSGRSVWQAILDAAKAQDAALIVMSTHGRTGLGRVLLGSVAEAVVQHSPIPVLLVKGDQAVTKWGK